MVVARTFLASLLCLSLAAATAQAEAPASRPVEELLAQGKEALKDERLDDAQSLFERGLALAAEEPTAWQMLLGLALASELRGDEVQAVSFYQAFVTRSDGHPVAAEERWAARRKRALEQIAELEEDVLTTHARLSIESEPRGAKLVVDEAVARGRVTPAVLYLLPGQHLVELRHEGFTPLLLAVSVARSQRIAIQRTMMEAPASAAAPQPVPVPVPVPSPPRVVEVPVPSTAPDSEPSALVPVGWTFGAVGLVGLVIGGGLTAAAASTHTELEDLRTQAVVDDAALDRDAALQGELQGLQVGSAASFASGGAFLVGGILMLLLEPEGPLGPRASAQGFGLGGTF